MMWAILEPRMDRTGCASTGWFYSKREGIEIMTRMQCAHCRQAFIAQKPTLARYCDNRCRQNAYLQRLRWTGRPTMQVV
jgi:hypothetical protein